MLPRSDSPPAEAALLKRLRSSHAASGDHSPSKPLSSLLSPRYRLSLILSVLALQLILLLSARSLPLRRRTAASAVGGGVGGGGAACPLGRVFVYDLPPRFNYDITAACDALNPWSSRCAALSNGGFGLPAGDLAGVVPARFLPSWHSTDQFASEIIYHRRILSHQCRTLDPSAAAAFYVSFYAGLAVGRHLWSSNSTSGDRDRDCADLVRWLRDQPHYLRSGGWDHFIMIGRITWDFRRSRDDDWGGSFLYMPGMENLTRLLIERNPWDDHDVAAPYPTGFHPRTAAELRRWQRFVLSRRRNALFSFAGAARAEFKDDFRGILLGECRAAGERCRSVDCGGGRCGGNGSAAATVSLFLDSAFCLQPRGDSFTRRSMFDCMVAGAVPVLFWRRSAYMQYEWYLPGGGAAAGEWSVFLNRTEVRSGKVSVREVLEGMGEERVRRMRERVVEMIPRLLYAEAEGGLDGGVKDAFDVAVDGVLRRFSERRRSSGEVQEAH